MMVPMFQLTITTQTSILFYQEAVGLKCNFLHSMMTQEVPSENKTFEVY